MLQYCFCNRSASETNWPPETSVNTTKTAPKVVENPFIVPGQFNDPLEEISKLSNSGSVKNDSVGNGRMFDDADPFDGLVRSATSFPLERDNKGKETSTLRADSSTSKIRTFTSKEINEKPSVRSPDSQTQKKVPVDNDWDFENSHKSSGEAMSPPFYANTSSKDANTNVDRSPKSEENLDSSEDIWLTVSEIPLFTQPTSAPPPSRPPPPRPVSKAGINSSATTNARRKTNELSSFPNSNFNYQVYNSDPAAARSSVVSPIDELEDFARGRSQDNVDDYVNGPSGEELEMNSVAAAMKEAMDRAEAKFRQAKEVRERESTKAARSKEGQIERDEKSTQDERAREKQERLERQHLQREREREEEEMEQWRLEKERERARELEREWEEKEREQRRLEKERERAREIEKEREKARQAVERATREARERAATEARQRAERAKAERAAVDKATAEARERAERAAVQRAQAEARERAAADAKERAEKAAAEARERANSEAKEREAWERAATARAEAEARARAAERAAVERAAAEARERAAAEARERAAAGARANQQKNDNDLESFFNVGGRANSAPRPRNTSVVRTF